MTDARRFEAVVLPLLDAGYNLARWLLHDDSAAEDAVQEACLRAFRYLHALRGDDARAWFLGIVRNTCFSQLRRQRGRREQTGLDDEEIDAWQHEVGLTASDPALLLQAGRQRAGIDAAIRALAPALREVIVLREIEGLDYAEIARVAGVPMGTVMSRLSRARARLKDLLVHAGVRDRDAHE